MQTNRKAMALARDVIAQVRSKRIEPQRGIYIGVEADGSPDGRDRWEDGDQAVVVTPGSAAKATEPGDFGDGCRVCAVGSFVIAAALRERKTFTHDGWHGQLSRAKLVSGSDACNAESAFEAWPEAETWLGRWGSVHDVANRLIAVMMVFIDNRGHFPYGTEPPSQQRVDAVRAGRGPARYRWKPKKKRAAKAAQPVISLPIAAPDWGRRILSEQAVRSETHRLAEQVLAAAVAREEPRRKKAKAIAAIKEKNVAASKAYVESRQAVNA